MTDQTFEAGRHQGFTEIHHAGETVAVVFDDDKHTCYVTHPLTTHPDNRDVVDALRAAAVAGFTKVTEQFTTLGQSPADTFETLVLTNR